MAAALGLEVDPGLDLNFVKMPLAGSLLAAATGYPTDVSVILNSDVILTQSFVDAVVKVAASFEDWFLTGVGGWVGGSPYIHAWYSACCAHAYGMHGATPMLVGDYNPMLRRCRPHREPGTARHRRAPRRARPGPAALFRARAMRVRPD